MNRHCATPLDDTPDAGFTLLEALVAVALTALLLSALSAAIFMGIRVWKGSDVVDRRAEILAIGEFLRQTLATAEPLRTRGTDARLTPTFKGTDQTLEFSVQMTEGALKAGAYRFVILLAPADKTGTATSQTLTIQVRPLIFENNPAENIAPQPTDLRITGIAALKIDYFGKPSLEQEAKWYSTWVAVDALPSLVRFRIWTIEGGPGSDLSWTAELKLR